ncbi:YueI family protein [Weissella ceti]|uniref:YueI family protein n=1 Tax=Weissella ceti TaxID=759620 RepID=A0ABT3E2C5_9LACO|nr:YueI family protein [Weissella ceti]MCW0952565.1 YueI family protein [Weissella ceti]QVK11771.1 YueI family protein [Weissella ceti]
MPEMDPHLQNALYGTPKLNPDEQNKYLGAYRERVYAIQTKASLDDAQVMDLWDDILTKYPDAVWKLNGHLAADELMPYIQLAKKHHEEFSMVTDSASARNDIVAVLVADHAVHKEDVYLEDMLAENEPQEQVIETNEAPKKKWYQRFF